IKKGEGIISTKKILFTVMTIDIVVLGLALILGTTPNDNFMEGGFVSNFSFLQLVVIAWLSLRIFIVGEGAAKVKPWKTKSFIWLIMAAAFTYLAIDEACCIHEGIDILIHRIFRIQETGITDRIDDILVGCYGLLGLIVLYYYREELKKYRKTFPLFITGYTVTFAMVGIDILTNRKDILSLLTSNSYMLDKLFSEIKLLEDMLKVLAEGIFIVAFCGCLKIARKEEI
ncbi:hypothetical protein KA005_77470, partial [bacterium]|nr:hypothetical protein [bacterium]